MLRSSALCLALALSGTTLFGQLPPVVPGFPNVAQTPGTVLNGLNAPEQGRTAIIAYHNGILFTVPEIPSSAPNSDFDMRTWDLSDPTNPVILNKRPVLWLLRSYQKMSRITIVQGHPDPQGEHFCHALVEAYAGGANRGQHEVRRVEVAQLDFPLLESQAEYESGNTPETLRDAQTDPTMNHEERSLT